MNQADEVQKQVVELISKFEQKKHILQERPAVGEKNLVFADVVILNKTEADQADETWYARRVVRTDIPQVFIWLFRQFVPILSSLSGYGMHKEEIFGRLGNTLVMVEELEPEASPDEKVVAVIQDFWEICQDLLEGRMQSFVVAQGADIMDDFVTRSIKSGFIDQETFENQIFGRAI